MKITEKLRGRRGLALGTIGGLAFVLLTTAGVTSAVAAGQITSADIKDQTIRSWDIHRDAVGASELRGAHDSRGPAVGSHHIRNGTILHWDIRNGTIGEQDLNEALQEKVNQNGEDGQDGVSGYMVGGPERAFAAGGTHTMQVPCPGDKVALGGGYQASADGAGGRLVDVVQSDAMVENAGTEDAPHWIATGWQVTFHVDEDAKGGAANMRIRVTCADVN